MNCGSLVVFASLFALCLNARGITVNDPDYTSRLFATSGTGDSLAIDSSGNLYVPSSSFNNSAALIERYAPNGSRENWSQADGFGISVGPNGVAFIAQREAFATPALQRIEPDGSHRSLGASSGIAFTWTAVSPTNELFASVWTGENAGIYSVDPSTGAFALRASLERDTTYTSLAFAPDGRLYTTVYGAEGMRVMRLDGDALTHIATVPAITFTLTFALNGDFFVAFPGPVSSGVIYKYEASSLAFSAFATGLAAPSGLAYDTAREILYVREQRGSIFAIDKVSAIPEVNSLMLSLMGTFTIGAVAIRRRRSLIS